MLEWARNRKPGADIFADIFGQPSPLCQLMDFGSDDPDPPWTFPHEGPRRSDPSWPFDETS